MANPAGIDALPVEIVFLVDVSGSMNSAGKIQSLNAAMEEALPFIRRSARNLIQVRPFARVISFGSQAQWVVAEATPLEAFRWQPVEATPGAMTELGAGLALVTQALDEPWWQRAPALILCTDGMPTDTTEPSFATALGALDAHPLGRGASRAAIAIGGDADDETLRAFLAASGGDPLSAQRPQQLAAQIRIASTSVLEQATSGIW